MATLVKEKEASALVSTFRFFKKLTFTFEEEIQTVIQYWIRILNIKLGWIDAFDTFVVNYAITIFMFNTFRSSLELRKVLYGHTNVAWSIDYSTFDGNQLICSGSEDCTVRVWDVENVKQINSFEGHTKPVYCVKFSPYHYYNKRRNVVCSSSDDNTIRFWDIKNTQLQTLNKHTSYICGLEFSSFNGGQYLCSGSNDKTVRLWDVETFELLHVFNGHENGIWCVDVSPLQSNSNDDNRKSNSIGVIGGNGYTICSGSFDNTIRTWDIETTKQLIAFEGHEDGIRSVKYGSNELGIYGGANTILSGSDDKSVRLWDIRSGQQIQMFNGHTDDVRTVEYSPFAINNSEIGGNSAVICSGSWDNSIRFWDIRSNKKELTVINEYYGIYCLKFLRLNIQENNNKKRIACGVSLCYCLDDYSIRVCG
ncbi:WD-40 repeat protein [Reticulomyxa filosa]|uniref:WD-40 repeat protein n=1 Tax=Reticulomyxa filosa TaxID=46433 RepID=X6MA37_RETFI|nr:WD-40 repeat protein [Reticulomyxa filosa]|eukprot:ETO10521.1 WD-40 repeat protein [Reticulomyxa filosa]